MLPEFLTKAYPLDKQLFLVPRFAFGILGFYPETERTTKVQILSFVNFCIMGYGIYAELYYGVYYLSTDIPRALDALCPAAASTLAFLKMFYIWYYREEFKYLIEKVRQLTAQQNSATKMNTKTFYFTLATRLSALVVFFGFCCSTSYTVRPIVTNTILYLNGEDIIYETPFKMMFPKPLLSMPLYPLTYLLVHWHGYMTVLSFGGTAGLFLGFCVYFASLLKALQEDVQSILTDVGDNSEQAVITALEDIVRRHNEIAELVETFSLIMVEITLTQFITSGIVIAISTFSILLFSGLGVLVYIAFTCAVFTEIFLYCLGGHSVIESSEELAMAAYCTQWYAYSVKIQKMVLLIMVRSQRTIIIKLPFFAPSLPAMTAIVRFTGSVFALAKSFI